MLVNFLRQSCLLSQFPDTRMSGTAILRTCFDVMHYSGASSVLRPYFAGRGVIFGMHHVYPGGGHETGFAPNARLAITPQFLGEIITMVRVLGYDLLSLEQAAARLKAGRALTSPFAVFTLDDGYKDNLVHALPVFRRHKCPFTAFVSPAIADGTCVLWWRALEAMIAGARSLDVDMAGQQFRFDTRDDGQKMLAWSMLSPVLQSMPEHQQRDWTLRWGDRLGLDVFALCRAAAMTWDELRTLNSDPLATIGAHTVHHYNLLKLDEAEARRELQASRRRIEEELATPVCSFAYPYGNTDAAGAREFRLAAATGFAASVTTRLGLVFEGHAQHLQALPRIMVSGRFQKARYIDALVSGIPAALVNRFQRLNIA
jgi:peptidoglycan/xylan/chitin deacetylase (PgdA/CDA1 family)